jgi:CHAT domain-containing protein/Tfp pilus assembly protein PilF
MKIKFNILVFIILSLHQTFYISRTSAEQGAVNQVFKFEDQITKASNLSELGLQQYRRGMLKDALQTFLQELEIRKNFNDPITRSRVFNNLGLVYSALGEQQKALDYFNEAITLLRLIHDRSGESRTLNNIGLTYSNLGQQYEALKNYDQALIISREMQDKLGESSTLNNIGLAYSALGEKQKALDFYNQSLPLSRFVHDRVGLARTLINIGSIYSALGQQQKALEYFTEALPLLRLLQDRLGEAMTINNIGGAYSALGERQKALDKYIEALLLSRSLGDLQGEANTANNIASIYSSLGEKQKALDYYNQALLLNRSTKNQLGIAITLDNIGGVYDVLNDKQKAFDYYDQALLLFRAIKDPRGEATTLNNIGNAYVSIGSSEKALDYFTQALPLYKTVQDPRGEATILNNIGTIYESLGSKEKALDYFSTALPIFQSIGDRQGEANTLRNLGETTSAQNRPQLAIFLLKQSVNTVQSLRKDIDKLPKNIQKTYAKSQSESYRILAKYLLEQGRVLEAQQVLDLLKVEEIDDYFRDNRRGDTQFQQDVIFLRSEQQLLDKYNQRLKSAIQIGQERKQLQSLSRSGQILTPSQQKRLIELDSLQGDIKGLFNQFIDSPDVQQFTVQLTRSGQEQISLNVFDKLRKNLSKLGNAALVYPLVLDDRIELIITTPDSPPLRRTVKIQRTELNQAIIDYRNALRFPSLDPKPSAQKLYRLLILPLEEDLKQANIKTIIYAPDGPLRYIPLAALYDGKQWIAERFAINNITAASLSDLSASQPSPPRVLAGAFANEKLSYKIKVGRQTSVLRGLPFAGKEVIDLAKTVPGTDKRIDRDFSLKTLKPLFTNFNILHFATHAAFFPGRPEDSFILFGDGERATLRSIEDWSLSGVDLVVLSACESGLGIESSPNNPKPDKLKLGNGTEILGLGYQFQHSGARATIASLWSVEDGGTQSLMSAFYKFLQKGNTKAEALRQAQVLLITGKGDPQAGIKNLDHPHYWAPFFIIGNGL